MQKNNRNLKAICADLHIGNNKNNPLFHQTTVKYAEWLKDTLQQRGIDKIIIAGDIFHDRVNINLLSMACMYQFFDILSDFRITVIPGNHDCWFLNNSTIHSIALLKKWKNVTVYDTPTLTDDIFYAPWGTTVEEMQPAKILIAHLETQSFDLGRGKICSHGMKASDVMEKYSVCLTGHFHKPQQRNYEGKLFKYLGSAFQLNWGEQGNKNHLTIIDTETLEIETIDNTVSPRFEYICNESDFSKIENNIISVQIEKNSDESNSFIDQVMKFKPATIKTELISQNLEEMSDEVSEFKLVEITETIVEFIGLMENIPEDCRGEVIARTLKLYEKFKDIQQIS